MDGDRTGARVVFVVLDGFPARLVGPDVTPTLCRLADAVDALPTTVPGLLPSGTYPNQATFVTGAASKDHRLFGNYIPEPTGAWTAAHDLGPAVPTVFERCADAGTTSACVVGDPHLIGVLRAPGATMHWPIDGRLPADVEQCDLSCALDEATLPRLCEAIAAGYTYVYGQLNWSDTVGHLMGPDSEAAAAEYRQVDESLEQVVDAIGADWGRTVLVVVSDHGMETVGTAPPIDLSRDGRTWYPDGGAALVRLGDGDDGLSLDDVDGVEGRDALDDDLALVWTGPGRFFGYAGLDQMPGQHGGPSTLAQLAVVSGGHPGAANVATAVSSGGFSSVDWAATLTRLLVVE